MRNQIKYFIWRATGKNRVIRMSYIFFRTYNGSLSSMKKDLLATAETFCDKEQFSYGRLIRRVLWNMYRYGIAMDEYFLYDFERLSHEQRQEYLTTFNRLYYYQRLNDHQYHDDFINKYATYRRFKPYYQRNMILLRKDNLDEFRAFVSKNTKFIYKPVSLSCGKGVKIYNSKDFPSLAELHSELAKSEGIVEELIVQDDKLGTFHPSSVNTVRIPSVIDQDGEVVIFSPIFRTGQKNRIVDNGGAGGILANIHSQTGVIYTDGADECGNRYIQHPETKVTFKGFQIPKWQEAVFLVREMAKVLPTVRYVGWDLALTHSGWVLVEANNRGEFKVLQIADKRGLKSSLSGLI